MIFEAIRLYDWAVFDFCVDGWVVCPRNRENAHCRATTFCKPLTQQLGYIISPSCCEHTSEVSLSSAEGVYLCAEQAHCVVCISSIRFLVLRRHRLRSPVECLSLHVVRPEIMQYRYSNFFRSKETYKNTSLTFIPASFSNKNYITFIPFQVSELEHPVFTL